MRAARIAALGVVGVALALPADAAESQEVARLTVTGDARLERPADELRLVLAVVTEAKSADDASAENAARMQRVRAALAGAGLGRDEVETGRFSVRPVYGKRPLGGDRPQIVGYRVENSVLVETPKIDRAGELVDAAVGAGANSVSSIAFGLADERAHRADAIREATRNARSDADALAEAAGLHLVRVLSASLGHAAPPPIPLRERHQVASLAQDAPTPIEPGDVTVRASVTLVFEIAEKE